MSTSTNSMFAVSNFVQGVRWCVCMCVWGATHPLQFSLIRFVLMSDGVEWDRFVLPTYQTNTILHSSHILPFNLSPTSPHISGINYPSQLYQQILPLYYLCHYNVVMSGDVEWDRLVLHTHQSNIFWHHHHQNEYRIQVFISPSHPQGMVLMVFKTTGS